LIESQTNITLNAGWNLISLMLNTTDSGTDRNISIHAGWNLIGYSSNTTLALSDAKFINSTGDELTWNQAITNGHVQAYLAYYDSSPASLSDRKYKYLSAVSGMDASSFEQGRGYWLYANDAGNLTLPGVGGSTAGQTFPWSKLRFSNGTDELNITDAGLGGERWIEDTLKYWGWDPYKTPPGYKFLSLSSGNLNSWQGYFIWSHYDNITLIRQN